MVKRMVAVCVLLALVLSLAGCKLSLNMLEMPSLPQVDSSSTLTAKIESVNGNQCTIIVTEGNGEYDKEDILYITYGIVAGNLTLAVGNTVTITYNYVKDVSEYEGLPHITVDEIAILTK